MMHTENQPSGEVFLGCLLSGLSTHCKRKQKLITFSTLGGYLPLGRVGFWGVVVCFLLSQSREMHIKNRALVNRANLVKVYWGHVLLRCLFSFKRYFHLLFLTLWKATVKNRERILPHHHVLSAFQHVFQREARDGVTSPAAGPSLLRGLACHKPPLLPKRCFPPKPRRG